MNLLPFTITANNLSKGGIHHKIYLVDFPTVGSQDT
jgi:hypothetical protein